MQQYYTDSSYKNSTKQRSPHVIYSLPQFRQKKSVITAGKPNKIPIFFHHNQRASCTAFPALKICRREERTKTVQQQTLHSRLTFLRLVTNQTAVVNAKNNMSARKRTAYDVQTYFRSLIKTERRWIPSLPLVDFHRSRLRPTQYKNEVSDLLKLNSNLGSESCGAQELTSKQQVMVLVHLKLTVL